LIGAGDIVVKRVAAALRDTEGSELFAVARARAELAGPFAASVGARRWYSTWRELLADPDIDAVYIATPVDLHAEQTIAAAEAGKHVLCEKPMAMKAAACERMIAACDANGVHLGVAYYRHFYPAVRRIKQVLASGEIGQPVVAQINAFERFNPSPDHPRHWFVEAARAGGGPMFDFGCHRLEVLLALFGNPTSVAGTVANVVFEREVEDTAVATLSFEDGPCATVTVTHGAATPQDTLDIFATDGAIHVGKLNAGDVRIVKEKSERIEMHPPADNLHAPLIADFVSTVSRGRKPSVTGEIGLAVAALEDAIYARSRARLQGTP
jgi:predicted dehydrogenase